MAEVKEAKVEEVQGNQEVQEEKKKINFKRIALYLVLVFVSLFGIFFWSTSVRWKDEISDKYEIVYFNQEDIKIDSIEDFFGGEMSTSVGDNDSYLMYCTSEHGGDCVTGDFNSGLENNLRHPLLIVTICILIDLILVLVLLRNKKLNKILVYAVTIVVCLYGLIVACSQAFSVSSYLMQSRGHDTVDAYIYKATYTESDKSFKPIMKYNIGSEEKYSFLDSKIKGNIKDHLNEKLAVYYRNEVISYKRSIVGNIIGFVVSILIFIIGFRFLKLRKLDSYEELQKEIEEEKKEKKKDKK